MAPVVYGFSPWLNSLVMLETQRNITVLMSSIYLFWLKYYQFYLAQGIKGRLNKLHNIICLQDNTFEVILYIVEIIRQ